MNKIKVSPLFSDGEKQLEKLYDLITNDPVIKQEIIRLQATEKEIRQSLATFYEIYLQTREKNQHLPDYVIKLERVNGYLEKVIEPNAALQKQYEEEARFYLNDSPGNYRDVTLGKIDLKKERLDLIKEAMDIINKKSRNWLYITGPKRIGKSFLANVILNELINAGSGLVAYIDLPSRIQEFQELNFNNKELLNQRMQKLTTCEVLVIDKFGDEYKSIFTRDTFVYPLLEKRVSNDLITIIVSEFSLEQIKLLYTLEKHEIKSRQMINLLKTKITKEYKISEIQGLY